MTWQSVGQHTFVPTDRAVQIGSFDLAPGQDTIWVKITQLNNPGDWPWSYGILSWRNSEGVPLGSVKAYSNRLGEVFRLGNGLAPLVGTGSIWFEPRGFNLGWLKAGFPWELQFEAQAGASDVSSGFWNRDPNNGLITPRTQGDNLDMTPGWIKAKNLILTDGTGAPVEKEVPGYQQGLWTPTAPGLTSFNPDLDRCVWSRIGNAVTAWAYVTQINSGATSSSTVYFKNLPYPIAFNAAIGQAMVQRCGRAATASYVSATSQGIAFYESNISAWLAVTFGSIDSAGNDGASFFGGTYITDDTTWSPQNGASVT